MPLTMSPFDLDKIYKTSGSERVLLNLVIENGDIQNATVIIKEVQAVPVTGQYLHIDFYEISLDEEIVVNVPIELVGKSKGVERGGFLQVVRHELAISCLPTDMPDKIEVDVARLDIGDSIHIGDIDLVGAKIRLLADSGLTVVTLAAPTVEEEKVPEEEAAEAVETEAGEAEVTGKVLK